MYLGKGVVMSETMEERIERHEGREGYPYPDSKGVMTIGIGRNLRDNPLTNEEIDYLFAHDLERVVAQYNSLDLKYRNSLNEIRREVIIEMIFQLGFAGTKGFVQMFKAIAAGNWEWAADEMLDSKWYKKDTPKRALELSELMRHGL
jgi:lysozyme